MIGRSGENSTDSGECVAIFTIAFTCASIWTFISPFFIHPGGAKGAEKIASSTKAPSRPGAKPAAGKAGKRVMAKGGVPKKK